MKTVVIAAGIGIALLLIVALIIDSRPAGPVVIQPQKQMRVLASTESEDTEIAATKYDLQWYLAAVKMGNYDIQLDMIQQHSIALVAAGTRVTEIIDDSPGDSEELVRFADGRKGWILKSKVATEGGR